MLIILWTLPRCYSHIFQENWKLKLDFYIETNHVSSYFCLHLIMVILFICLHLRPPWHLSVVGFITDDKSHHTEPYSLSHLILKTGMVLRNWRKERCILFIYKALLKRLNASCCLNLNTMSGFRTLQHYFTADSHCL